MRIMSAMYTLVWRISSFLVSEDSNRSIAHLDLHTLTVITPTVDYSGVYPYELTKSEL